MSWIRWVLFLMAFQLNIRVRADYSDARKGVDFLQGSLYSESGGVWTLARGGIRVHSVADGKIVTLFAEVEVAGKKGEFWVLTQEERTVVKNISNKHLNIRARDGREFSIPEGFEVWIGGIDTQGRSDIGVIREMDMKTHLKLLAQVYKGTKKEFYKEIDQLKQQWPQKISKGRDIQLAVVQRAVASVWAAEQMHKDQQKKIDLENQKIKKRFYQKVFQTEAL